MDGDLVVAIASTEETLGWLVGQGLLDPQKVWQWLKEHQ